MLIKLLNKFYQVQCDPFVNLATELLDIRPDYRLAIPRWYEKAWNLSHLNASIRVTGDVKGLISLDAAAIVTVYQWMW